MVEGIREWGDPLLGGWFWFALAAALATALVVRGLMLLWRWATDIPDAADAVATRDDVVIDLRDSVVDLRDSTHNQAGVQPRSVDHGERVS